MKHFKILFLLLAFFAGCKKSDCFENAGTITITERAAAPFNRIDVYDNIDLVIKQDSVEKISVESGYYLQPNIVTQIQKGVLTIQNKTGCSLLRNLKERIKVYVSVKNLNKLNYQGSGNVTSDGTIQTDTLTIYSEQGAGTVDLTLDANIVNTNIQHESPDFILHGKANLCFTYVDSRGTIDFSDFKVNYMGIGYTSVRDATIYVTGGMDAQIYHTGNLYVKGNPQNIVTKYYSTGRLIKLP